MALTLNDDRLLFKELQAHLGHQIVCVTYGDLDSVSLECEDCCEVLISAERDSDEERARSRRRLLSERMGNRRLPSRTRRN